MSNTRLQISKHAKWSYMSPLAKSTLSIHELHLLWAWHCSTRNLIPNCKLNLCYFTIQQKGTRHQGVFLSYHPEIPEDIISKCILSLNYQSIFSSSRKLKHLTDQKAVYICFSREPESTVTQITVDKIWLLFN